MVLIFGGAYQGKFSYARERFGLTDADIYCCPDGDTKVPAGRAVYGFERWILALLDAGRDVLPAVRSFIAASSDTVVISRDISCGVVPADPRLRAWRDETGKALAMVARASDEAVRLFCGIPSRIK